MKAYEPLELEVIKFEAQDVITASAEAPVVEDNAGNDYFDTLSPEVQQQMSELFANGAVTVYTDADGNITGWDDADGNFHEV